jgi:hypothetical protein
LKVWQKTLRNMERIEESRQDFFGKEGKAILIYSQLF